MAKKVNVYIKSVDTTAKSRAPDLLKKYPGARAYLYGVRRGHSGMTECFIFVRYVGGHDQNIPPTQPLSTHVFVIYIFFVCFLVSLSYLATGLDESKVTKCRINPPRQHETIRFLGYGQTKIKIIQL